MTVFLPLFSDSDLGSLDPGPLKSSVVELMLSDVVAIVVVVVLSVGLLVLAVVVVVVDQKTDVVPVGLTVACRVLEGVEIGRTSS
jgi:hypothetical protein